MKAHLYRSVARIRRTVAEVARRPRLLLRMLLVAMLLTPVTPGSALVSVPITINGEFSDWTSVIESAENCSYDPTGEVNSNADLTVTAATSHSDRLYVYVRRASSSGLGLVPLTYRVHLDLDGDSYLESTDRVLEFTLWFNVLYGSPALYEYAPQDTVNGDPMGGPIAGGLGDPIIAAGALDGDTGADGCELEGSVTWAALGVSANAPIGLQFAAMRSGETDHAAPISFAQRLVLISEGRSAGTAAGMQVVYEHSVTNTGNVTLPLSIEATSTRGWPLELRVKDAGTPVAPVHLLPGATITIEAVLSVPVDALDGARDTVTVTAASTVDPDVKATATNEAAVGPMLVIPNRTGSITPGGTIRFTNTVQNNTDGEITVALQGVSDRGWPVTIRTTSGTPLTELTLTPRQSVDICVDVTAPADAALGTMDVTRVEASTVAPPVIKAAGYDTVTVGAPLTVVPPGSLPAGAGTSVLYRHTITNNTASARTLSLTASSSRGWPVQVLSADGATLLSSVTIPPYGGSLPVTVRVTVPAGTPELTTCRTTLTVADGAGSASVEDTTIVSSLVTFGVGGFGTPLDEFALGDRVYARGMGLTAGQTIIFEWVSPGGIITSKTVRSDAGGIAQSNYDLSPTDETGMWTVRTSVRTFWGTTPLAEHQFFVGYRARITSMTTSGGDEAGSPIAVSTVFHNGGEHTLAGTEVTYLLWRDADGDGTLNAGDAYIAGDGAWTEPGTGVGYTHKTSDFTVPANTAVLTDAWSVVNQYLKFAGTYTLRAEWVSADGMTLDTRSTTFFATPGGPGLSLTISKTEVDFGAVDPGRTYTDPGIGLTVRCRTGYTLRAEVAGQAAELGLATTLPSETTGTVTSGATYIDIPSITVPWRTVPGMYAATITYTVVADIQ